MKDRFLSHFDPQVESDGRITCFPLDKYGRIVSVPLDEIERCVVTADVWGLTGLSLSKVFGLDFPTILALIHEYDRRVPDRGTISPAMVREVFNREPLRKMAPEDIYPLAGA